MINENSVIEFDKSIQMAYRKKVGGLVFDEQIALFVKQIKQDIPLYPVEMERQSKPLNYRVSLDKKKCYLNSRFDPQREMEMCFADISPDTEVLVVFGMGLGYVAEYAGEHLPQLERVIIVEPSSQILGRVLAEKDVLERLKKVPSVTFIWNKTQEHTAAALNAELTNYMNQRIGLMVHVSYHSLFRDHCDGVMSQVLQHIRSTQVNIATVRGNIFLKTQNIINNLKYDAINVRHITERLQGRTAIMVSAGPSLDKNVHLLEEARDKAFIVAVGTAIKTLYNKGIRPHARAAFSPYPDENLVFDGIEDYEDIPLIFSNTLDYLVVKNYNAPKARMVMFGDPITQFFFTRSGFPFSLVGGGSTIANVTFDLLCRAGCSKVIMIGQDMAYTGMKLYSSDAWGQIDASGQEKHMVKTIDQFGQEIYTTKPLFGLKAQFEAMVAGFSGVEVINATEGGLSIDGARHTTLRQALDELQDTFNPDGMLEEAFAGGQAEAASDQLALQQSVEQTMTELDEILAINNQRFLALARLREENSLVADKLKALQKIDEYEERLMQMDFYRLVLAQELQTPFFTIRAGFKYNGSDKKRRAESIEKTLVGITMKLHEYASFVKEQMALQLD